VWRIYYRNANQGTLARASLLQSLVLMSRRITLLLALCVLLLFVFLAPPRPGSNGWQMLGITTAWIAVSAAAFHLAGRHLLQAHALLLGSAALLLPLAVSTSGQGLLVALYGGLPALAMMLVGWPAGLAAAVYTAVAPTAFAAAGAAPPLPVPAAFALGAFGALAAALCWIVVTTLLGLAETALLGLERAQAAVDEARGQRLELKQVEEDLLQSTREQGRLLERLKAMNQVAEEARQTKQDFIAKVSHELRTPLNMIIAYSELITGSPGLYGGRIPPALLADMAVILRNSQHLAKLVDDVLDLSQIDAGRMALSKTWAEMGIVIAEAAEAVRPLFATKGLSLELAVPPTSPRSSATPPAFARC
jgi:signal transduction histidine kinase